VAIRIVKLERVMMDRTVGANYIAHCMIIRLVGVIYVVVIMMIKEENNGMVEEGSRIY